MASQKITAMFSTATDEPIGVCPYASSVTREWVFNDFGPASFYLPGSTPNLSRYLQDGNIVRLFEEGVPTWVGMADEQGWAKGSVQLRLKSAEWFLSGKMTPMGMQFTTGTQTSGQIAAALFQAALRSARIQNLKPGTFDATPVHFKQYDYADLFDAFSELVDADGSAFWVDDALRVHVRNQRGNDLTTIPQPVVLYEDHQLVDVTVTRRITNTNTAIMALSNGANLASKYKYGVAVAHPTLFRAKVENLNVNALAQMEGPANQLVDRAVEPEVLVDCTMLRYNTRVDGRPQFAEWGRFWVGDIVRLVLYSMASPLDVRVKVLGISKDESDKIRLVVKVLDQFNNAPIIRWAPA